MKAYYIPESKLAMIVSWPYFAFHHADSAGVPPYLSKPRNSHDLVVCRIYSLLKKTETISGFSAPIETHLYMVS